MNINTQNIIILLNYFNSKLSQTLGEQNFREHLALKSEHGQTVLHVACQLGYTKMIIQLLEFLEKLSILKEIIDSLDNNNCTPLILVIKSTDDGVPEAVEALLKYHANPNVCDKQGNTALHYAASMGQEECCEILLVSKQIQIDCQNIDGQTPLIQSIIEGQFNIINMLLNHKIHLEIQDKKGRTAIHYAAITKGNSPAYIRILADKCDLNKSDTDGNTPLLLAASTSLKKHYRAIETLINLKVDLLQRNKENKLAQNYIENLDSDAKSTEYYSLLKNAFKKKGIILLEENTNGKRESHKQQQQENSEELDNHEEIEGGCCGESESSCCGGETQKSKDKEQKNKKSGCCGSGNCGDKKEGKSCGNNCGCKSNSCKIPNKSIESSNQNGDIVKTNKSRLDFQEKFIIASLIPLNILFFYLLFQFLMQNK